MNKKAKIVVLHMKELLYTGLFFLLGILFVIIIILMFSGKDSSLVSDTTYTPGQYTTTLTLNGSVMDVVVTVDETAITSIELEHLEETNILLCYFWMPLLPPWNRQKIRASLPKDARILIYTSILSNCSSHKSATASEGMRKSPLGETDTLPTFGPSGKQERLNCCVKKRRQ